MKANYVNEGLLVVISGPSGVGKGTVCKALREMMPELTYSISATTRSPREGEVDGVNYFFKSVQEFEKMIEEDELIEWAQYVGNYYGTPRHFVEETLAKGRDVVLEIEVQGAMQVKEKYPQGIFIFLVPPSFEELRQRIIHRGTESESVLNLRLEAASDELKQIDQYDYVVINDEVDKACERIRAIVMAEHCRTDRLKISEDA
ncbi:MULTISPECIES: guanylate kinase [Thermoactinomyces]|jgi:guanylate kinase|uniref:Guanylate kinase n=1 Tax=Thermoactinomyces vulgaris TaxID=2026 RepID=A0ABS0QJ83_THEVU|nr:MULTISPECIES: guanylate kinase [Thermoactinomyces]KFZ40611.1 guanylate kinase [Thermoactinomyces sp. Gus2-1]MBA4551634.1 guanylate kinase [Thermoactinomyces vulgaris]MBA4596487.1 guanylate kinase [Thermoactinomyces vulgaris]MBH8582782.1 guanylate kinase [Thermoactinomyces sp. CICC 10735]MBH8585573.1 guanylate kinase [Thermoactinomyces sp. CICC 10520]